MIKIFKLKEMKDGLRDFMRLYIYDCIYVGGFSELFELVIQSKYKSIKMNWLVGFLMLEIY